MKRRMRLERRPFFKLFNISRIVCIILLLTQKLIYNFDLDVSICKWSYYDKCEVIFPGGYGHKRYCTNVEQGTE